MLRIILAGILMVALNVALNFPVTTKSAVAAGLSSMTIARGGQGLVPQMVEYARASGKPVGPKAPGGVYCYAPLDGKGRLDFDGAKAIGSVTRAVALKNVTLKAANGTLASRLYLQNGGKIDKQQNLLLVAGKDKDSDFFERPMTADEFCAMAQNQFDNRGYAFNIW
ncbi:MAG: hypothetical protein AB7G06_02880 [Bdellovibrionales bacterium]